jgi:hypothetical protein
MNEHGVLAGISIWVSEQVPLHLRAVDFLAAPNHQSILAESCLHQIAHFSNESSRARIFPSLQSIPQTLLGSWKRWIEYPIPSALVLPLIANAQSRCEGWWHLCSYLCNMGQTRVFAASIMMLTERVVRTCFYNWRVDMGITGKPGKESNKATLARIKKEMAQPRIVKSARKGASTRHDSQRPRHDRLSPQLLP